MCSGRPIAVKTRLHAFIVQRAMNWKLKCCYFAFEVTVYYGPKNKLWFSIAALGGFLLAPDGPGCKSSGQCHLYCKRYKCRETMGLMQPKIWLFSWYSTCESLNSGTNNFWRPFVVTHSEAVSAQRNTHSVQILYTVLLNNCFLEGNFCLCVENIMHVLDVFFLHIKS